MALTILVQCPLAWIPYDHEVDTADPSEVGRQAVHSDICAVSHEGGLLGLRIDTELVPLTVVTFCS